MQISIWENDTFFAHQDVIIIGAGLAGLWAAYELINHEPNFKITILEAGIIPTGASTRNAGFACFGSPTELLHDAANAGADEMWQTAEMRFKGIEKIKTLFGSQIAFDNCGGYECLQNAKHDVSALKDQLHWLNAGLASITGNKEVFTWANDKLPQYGFIGFDAMIENKLEGGLHSGKLVQALTQKVQQLGVKIYTGIAVTHWEELADGVAIFTSQNIIYNTNKLLVCTNAFGKKLLHNIDVVSGRGQVLVTAPINGLKMRGTFHFDEGFYYFRNIGNRILLGGARNMAFEEETTTTLETTTTIQHALEVFLYEHLLSPSQKINIDYRWSGIMGFTTSKLPVIQKISNNIIAIIACNGMGVALTPIIAEEVVPLIL